MHGCPTTTTHGSAAFTSAALQSGSLIPGKICSAVVTARPGDSGCGPGVRLMSLEIRQETPTPGALGEHGRISIAFVVDQILEVSVADGGLGGMALTETPVADSYATDYDTIEGEGPARWAECFDVSN